MVSDKIKLKSIPTPKCCDAQKKHPTIRAVCYDDDYSFPEDVKARWHSDPLIVNSWTLYSGEQYTGGNDIAESKFCPFCGKALPELIKKDKPPKNVCVVTDGGYYCDTCEKRLDSCKCYPPEARWRIKRKVKNV